MSLHKYRIELRVEFDDETKYKTMRNILRNNARKLLTQATMVADARRPQVYIEGDSFAEGTEQITLENEDDD